MPHKTRPKGLLDPKVKEIKELWIKTCFNCLKVPEMFVLCNICYFRNPVRLVLVLAGIIESWTASLGIFGLINVANVWRVCISTAATELDIKYFCPMKNFASYPHDAHSQQIW